MRNAKAVFKKQFKGMINSPESLMQFIIFPLIAFIFKILINFEDMAEMTYEMLAAIPDMTEELLAVMPDMTFMTDQMMANMPDLTIMQAIIFAGMGLIPVVAGIIAEDIEKKSLRFLIMAGVKPSSYLLGIGGVLFFFSLLTSVAFAFIGGFGGWEFWLFSAAMLSGVAASIVLGAAIGILTKNQQSATGLAMPFAVLFGFIPVIAQFNDQVARIFRFTYTQQLNIIAANFTTSANVTPIWQSFAIMWANVAVFGFIFVLIFKAKGLKG